MARTFFILPCKSDSTSKKIKYKAKKNYNKEINYACDGFKIFPKFVS